MTDKKQKKCILTKLSWASWVLLVLVVACIVTSAFSIHGYIVQKKQNAILQDQIDSLKSQALNEGNIISEDSLYIEYYKELSNKTDNAIGTMITIVVSTAGVIMIFTTLAAFRAPIDIENRIEELKKETNDAKEAIKKAEEATEEAEYQTRIIEALLQVKENIIEAERLLSKAINDYPSKPYAYMHRGRIKIEMGNYDGALSDYQLAHNLGMDRSAYFHCVASVYYAKDDFDKEIMYSSKAIEEDPKEVTNFYNRGLSYFEKGKIKEALQDMEDTLAACPEKENPLAYYTIFKCYVNLMVSEVDPDKKIEYESLAELNLNEAFRLYPKHDKISLAKKDWDKTH